MMDDFLGLSSSSAVSPVTHQVSAGEAGPMLACECSAHPRLAERDVPRLRALSSLEQHFPGRLKGFVYRIHMPSSVLSALRAGYDSVSEKPLAIKYRTRLNIGSLSVAGYCAFWSPFEIPRRNSGLPEMYQGRFQNT